MAHKHCKELDTTEATSVQFCSVQLLSHVRLFATPWTAAHQGSLSITNSQSPPKLMSIESVMPSNHLILCHPLLLPPSIFPSISSVQFSPVTQSCPTLCDPMNRSTPGLPIHHQLLEFTQTHVHHLILRRPLLLLPPIPPSIRVFSNESTLCKRWLNVQKLQRAHY